MACHGCRFWSDRLAQAAEDGVQAMCLNYASPNAWEYTYGNDDCPGWKHNLYGAVDSRGEESEIAALYAAEDVN